ncbi:MAG: hypothetical protein CVU38_16390 [Chloroflexi bacterium HGW-Chloroflexi-1]|nr:MAG: hypothetical protein CVU38_16390 [Chloroflexi bacterium HGW-Chloroflexi-1]
MFLSSGKEAIWTKVRGCRFQSTSETQKKRESSGTHTRRPTIGTRWKLPVYYKGVLVGDYEADFVVEDKIILELKAVSTLHPKHEAQAINYLTATGLRLAILLNFGADSLQHPRVVK